MADQLYQLSRSGRRVSLGTTHRVTGVDKSKSDGNGWTYVRIHVGDGGYFDNLHAGDFKIGMTFVEVESDTRSEYGRTDYVFVKMASTQNSQGAEQMVGQVYSAAVVRTKTVAAGEGVSTGVQVSEVVSSKSGFIASSDENAKAIALAEAIVESKGTLDINDATQPIEVKLAKFA